MRSVWEGKSRWRRRKKRWIVASGLLGSLLLLAYFLQRYWAHREESFVPDYPRVTLTEDSDYETFLMQTGLGKSAVDKLLEEGDFQTILEIQDAFFRPVDRECEPVIGWFTREDRLVWEDTAESEVESRQSKGISGIGLADRQPVEGGPGSEATGRQSPESGSGLGTTERRSREGSSGLKITDRQSPEDVQGPPLVDLQPGDILLTLSTHSLGWRHGHAALVIDENTTLECAVLGTDSSYGTTQYWRGCAEYCVLRVKDITPEQQREVAEYACDTLYGVPYHLTSGFIGPKAPEPDSAYFGLQCAYLVWYAWNHFGYDLDADGGRLVTAYDLLQSELLEVVQVYGMDLQTNKRE